MQQNIPVDSSQTRGGVSSKKRVDGKNSAISAVRRYIK